MSLTLFAAGFAIKIITGLDDVITRIPILSNVARTRTGQVAFSIGTLLGIALALLLADLIAIILKAMPFSQYLVALLLFLLAAAVYFELFGGTKHTAEQKLLHLQKISLQRFFVLLGIGFITSLATVLDDVIAFIPVLNGGGVFFPVAGIFTATILELVVIIYFADFIRRIPHKEKIAAAGLVVLGLLVLAGIL